MVLCADDTRGAERTTGQDEVNAHGLRTMAMADVMSGGRKIASGTSASTSRHVRVNRDRGKIAKNHNHATEASSHEAVARQIGTAIIVGKWWSAAAHPGLG